MTSPIKETIDFSSANLEAERAEIMAHYGKAAESLAEIGKRLASLKKRLESGNFLAFLDSLPFSQKSAYNFMRLAEHAERYGLVTVTSANVTIAAWYIAPPQDNALIDKIMQKAQEGKKVTKEDVKALISSTKIHDDRVAYAFHNAAEESPELVIETIKRGAMTTVQGLDIPIEDLSAADVTWANEQDKWERRERQKVHIQEASPSQKWTTELTSFEMQKAIQALLPAGMKAPAIGSTITLLWRKEAD